MVEGVLELDVATSEKKPEYRDVISCQRGTREFFTRFGCSAVSLYGTECCPEQEVPEGGEIGDFPDCKKYCAQ